MVREAGLVETGVQQAGSETGMVKAGPTVPGLGELETAPSLAG